MKNQTKIVLVILKFVDRNLTNTINQAKTTHNLSNFLNFNAQKIVFYTKLIQNKTCMFCFLVYQMQNLCLIKYHAE
jgi:hypothetical protein